MNLTFSKLKSDDNYDDVAELIYKTDAYLYPDLFGSLENAKKIIPYLLNDHLSTMYRDYIYVAKDNGKIIGIVSILPHSVEWDFNRIRLAYMEAGLTMGESVYAVSEYFQEAFCKIGNGSNACNICVSEEYRNKGVGSFILERVIHLAGKSTIELSVLSHNEAAVKLYKKFGFVILGESDDYGGFNKPKVPCLSMARIGTI